jgi:hypothetical protein
MLQLLETAAEVTSASTHTYITVLNAIVEQQKLAQQASLEWLSGVISAQSNVREQRVESYDSVKGELSETAEESTRLAGQLGAKAAKSSSNAVSSVNKKQSNAVTETARRPTPTTSKSASASAVRPEPAKWTSEAYESLTAAEIVEKLPQLSQHELAEVETYEKAHQSRLTVLQRIGSLHGQQPVTGYDELNVQEIQKLLAEGDDKLSARVRVYERPRKSRDGVLHAADAQLSKS